MAENVCMQSSMDRIPVQSREIAVVGYEDRTETLEITFRRGGVYHYYEVPSGIHRELLKADSIGTYFTREIKERYSYQKVC